MEIGPDPRRAAVYDSEHLRADDNLSWTHGKHTFRAGFDGIDWISPQFFTQRGRGDYEWSNTSDYLFDYYPDYLAQRNVGGRTYYGDNQLYGMYLNDIYKVRDNITLNIGARYEYQTVPLGIQEQSLNSVASVPGLISFASPQTHQTEPDAAYRRRVLPRQRWQDLDSRGFGTAYDQIPRQPSACSPQCRSSAPPSTSPA